MKNPDIIHNDTLRHLYDLRNLDFGTDKKSLYTDVDDEINDMMNRFLCTFFGREVGDE